MKKIVIDVSMALVWSMEDEKCERGDEILDESTRNTPITTTLFWYEYRNALISNLKRDRISRGRISVLMNDIRKMKMKEYPLGNDEKLISLALKYELSAYDAAYLVLADEENAVLATNDKKLARAAWLHGIEILSILDTKEWQA